MRIILCLLFVFGIATQVNSAQAERYCQSGSPVDCCPRPEGGCTGSDSFGACLKQPCSRSNDNESTAAKFAAPTSGTGVSETGNKATAVDTSIHK